MSLGFYTKLADINSLIVCLKQSLKSIIQDERKTLQSLSQMSRFQISSEGNSSTHLLVDCKKKICDILMNISTLKSDLEMRLFLNKLKEVAITQAEFKKLSKSTSESKDKPKGASPKKRAAVFAQSNDS